MCLQNSAPGANLTNPCYPQHYVISFTWDHIFDSPCTEDLRPGRHDPGDTLRFEGTGDSALCREKVASLFAFKACHDGAVCCFDGVYQPRVKGSFVVRADTAAGLPFSPAGSYFSPSVSLLLAGSSLPCPRPGTARWWPIPSGSALSCFLPGLCRLLLRGCGFKSFGELFSEHLQLQDLGFLLTELESGRYLKRKDRSQYPTEYLPFAGMLCLWPLCPGVPSPVASLGPAGRRRSVLGPT